MSVFVSDRMAGISSSSTENARSFSSVVPHLSPNKPCKASAQFHDT